MQNTTESHFLNFSLRDKNNTDQINNSLRLNTYVKEMHLLLLQR